jgi:pyruvate/2-oxoglutarate/acetoin dehydrogenase E1 component
VSERFLVEAVNDALHVEMERDASVMVHGRGRRQARRSLPRDRGAAGAVRSSDRCVDTPLAEAGILGTAVGLCMAGWRPVVEMQYDAFSYPALDQLINHVGRYRWRTRGTMSFPLTIRMPYGGGVRAPELHDDSPETYYVHTPGVKVAIPSNPADAKGLLAAAIRDPDPVVVLEPKLHYRTAKENVPTESTSFRSASRGRARGLRPHDRRVRGDGARRARGRETRRGRGVVRGARPALAQAARRGRSARIGGERPRVVIVQEAPRVCGFAAEVAAVLAEKSDLRPARAGRARDRVRRPVSVLADRGRVHAVGRSACVDAVRRVLAA